MYSTKLQSKYYKTILYSNFLNMDHTWTYKNNSDFNKLLIILKWKPKRSNKKSFLVSIMLLEFVLKGPSLNMNSIQSSFAFLKSFINKKIVTVTYTLKNIDMYIFLDSFITNIYWRINEKTNITTNELKVDFEHLTSVNYNITKLLDIANYIGNKIQLESYLIRRSYSFNIVFSSLNLLYYLWWTRSIGFYKFI